MKIPCSGLIMAMILVSTNGWTQQPGYKGKLTIPDSSHYQIIETKDGSDWEGRITEISETSVHFVTRFGEMKIPIQDIKEIETLEMSSIKEGRYWFPNPNATRLFFAPTGRMLPQGKGYFADYYIFFPSLTFGINNHCTLGGGMSLIPGAGLSSQAFFLTPKFGLSASEHLHIAAGVLAIIIPTEEDDEESFSIGILYGVGTLGSPDQSLTFGLGYGYEKGNLADSPILVLGGESRVSSRIALVTENWFGAGLDGAVLSFGMRFLGRRLSADFALAAPVGQEESFAFPYLDFIYAF